VTGAAAHIAFDPRRDVPLIGASGGISTILAFYALRFPGARVGWLLWRLPAAFYFAIWVGFQLLTSIAQAEGSSDVSAFAHLGGAGAGVAFWAIQRRMEAWNCRGAAPS
jgi:membrane associated rhomboid family serine protease